MPRKSNTVRKNFRLPADLADWVERYAQGTNTTMTRIIIDHFNNLRRESENAHAEQV